MSLSDRWSTVLQQTTQFLGHFSRSVLHVAEQRTDPDPHLPDVERSWDPLENTLFGFATAQHSAANHRLSTEKSAHSRSLLIALCDLIVTFNAHARHSSNQWADHLVTERHFFGAPRIEAHQLVSEAIPYLIVGATESVRSALHVMLRHSTTPPHYISAAEQHLTEIAHTLGAPVRHPRPSSLAEMIERSSSFDDLTYRLGVASAKERIADGTIFAFRDNTDPIQLRFPAFQFEGRSISPLADWLATNTGLTTTSLETCFWVHLAVESGWDRTQFETTLASLTLLIHETAGPNPTVAEYLNAANNLDYTHPEHATLYRICNQSHGPFYFASAQETGVGGRFDLQQQNGRGTMYTATEPRGAYAEVFGGDPVASLELLLTRSIWHLTPRSGLTPICDVRSSNPNPTDCTDRRTTQTFATALADRHRTLKGIAYQLRSDRAQTGVALFGGSGANGPVSTWGDAWTTTCQSVLSDDACWEYIKTGWDSATFPFLLQRQHPGAS